MPVCWPASSRTSRRRRSQWLEENDQLHGAGPLNNAWGFIPGEGAGAVLLVTERTLARLHGRVARAGC